MIEGSIVSDLSVAIISFSEDVNVSRRSIISFLSQHTSMKPSAVLIQPYWARRMLFEPQ